MRKLMPLVLISLLAAGAALAQSSASYEVREHAFNDGGDPEAGIVPTSASFRISLEAIGDAVSSFVMPAGPSFVLGGGFAAAYPPPGEVLNVRFTGASTLEWDPEKSTGVYNLYQGDVLHPWDPDFGMCTQAGLPVETATIATTPAAGQALFVLVTAENLLNEEGTKGAGSDGTTRANLAACP